MPTIKLYDAIREGVTIKISPGLIKHLKAASIKDWDDVCNKWKLSHFANVVKGAMASSSAHTHFAVFKAFLGKFEDEINLPKGWREILNAKMELPMNTYLTKDEVEAFGEAYVENDMERTVRDGFYVSCKTGLRHSDLVKLTPANFDARGDGSYILSYVSKKTRIQSNVPCSWATVERIAWLHKNGANVSLEYYNSMVRKLAERADINAEVSVFRAGKELVGPKWKFLSSHSARRSFATILADLGTDILDIMRLCGHTSPAMSARYIVRHEVKVNPNVERFLIG